MGGGGGEGRTGLRGGKWEGSCLTSGGEEGGDEGFDLVGERRGEGGGLGGSLEGERRGKGRVVFRSVTIERVLSPSSLFKTKAQLT